MKYKSYLLVFVCILFYLNAFSQKLEWSAFLSTNYTYFGLEDDNYQAPQVIQFEFLQADKYNITRVARAQIGFGFGTTLKIKVIDNFYILTGIQSQLIQYKKIEFLRLAIEGQPGGSSTFPDNPFTGIEGGTINRRIVNESYQDYISNIPYTNKNPFYLNQKMAYLKIPLNIGFSPNSKRWIAYAGLWYGRLISADFGIDKSIIADQKKFFNQNNLGVNVGLEIRFLKKLSLTLNYFNFANDFYADNNPLEKTNRLYLDSINRNQYIESFRRNQYSVGIAYSFLSAN